MYLYSFCPTICKQNNWVLSHSFRFLFQIQIEIIRSYNLVSVFDKEFIMCESDVYFETYRHVYNVLKLFNDETFPMKNYIIDVDVNVQFNSY